MSVSQSDIYTIEPSLSSRSSLKPSSISQKPIGLNLLAFQEGIYFPKETIPLHSDQVDIKSSSLNSTDVSYFRNDKQNVLANHVKPLIEPFLWVFSIHLLQDCLFKFIRGWIITYEKSFKALRHSPNGFPITIFVISFVLEWRALQIATFLGCL